MQLPYLQMVSGWNLVQILGIVFRGLGYERVWLLYMYATNPHHRHLAADAHANWDLTGSVALKGV